MASRHIVRRRRYSIGSNFVHSPSIFTMATFKPWSLIVLFAFVFRTTGRPSTMSPPPVPRARQALQNSTALSSPSLPRSGLNAAARSAGKLYFGTATNNYELDDTAYVAILDDSAMFGQLTPAKAMKWNHTEPERGVFTWEEGDQIVALARQGGKLMRGHNCVWYNEIPDWVTNTTWTAPELAEVVQEHCFNIVRHWAGQICTFRMPTPRCAYIC
ncbi:glycoside hydrolase superfamily [Ganoderma leucocontextum]|nr:glycoside hydrolase superfamily [Ganoderma leucocontextum]